MDRSKQLLVVAVLMLVFTTWFLHNTKQDFNLIFQKDLLAHDESSNSVVAANVTRKFFPPMVRTNPLVEAQGNWMEGPFWQHIPPLFAYVPYVFFKLDGQISIEVKRLSFAFITLLTGLLFIFGVYQFRKSLWASVAATLAAIFWVNTPFTRELITGYAFGVSDIVLAFSVVAGFCGVLWYLAGERADRLNYSFKKLALIGLLVALPIVAKNLLGAIPAATFFILLFLDHREFNKKIFVSIGAFLGLLLVYLLPLYLTSPETFKSEILVSFFHAQNYEGWGRPWHWYITNYLPQRYLFNYTWVFFGGLAVSLYVLTRSTLERRDRVLLLVSGGWFIWNILAVSMIESKIPNFIYQSYLLSLFFCTYGVSLIFVKLIEKYFDKLRLIIFNRNVVIVILAISVMVTSYEILRFAAQFQVQRAAAYNYQTEREKFYETAEELHNLGANTNDLIIIRVSDSDCWFRYYPLFLTGTESKALLELSFGFDPRAIKNKYARMFFITKKSDKLITKIARVIELKNYTAFEFDLSQMDVSSIRIEVENFLSDHYTDIAQDIVRIKKDKTSCQWLVPDPILNAP